MTLDTTTMDLQSNLTDSRMPDELVGEYAARQHYFAMTDEHLHPHYEMYILLAGERQYFIRDQVYTVHAGDIVFIGKHELHRTLPGQLPEHERIVLYFNDTFATKRLGAYANWLLTLFDPTHPVYRPQHRQHMLHEIIQQLVRELNTRAQGYQLMVEQLAIQILLHCARQPSDQPTRVDSSSRSAVQGQMSAVARHIREHYTEPLPLQRLAEQCHLSPAHLSRIFKKTTGFHVTEYINTIRVQAARELLSHTEMRIIDVAAAAGFGNVSHFGKVFKHICHISPRQYRQTERKKQALPQQ
ncbi:helix-turn-helix domain-containing protein [Paenibacillus sp. WLX1005]|uniref:helix-turn-helix domain-containing protein n=1 Tax=Paenibacillus sp. WLX1005 TaxID=3243766 RepID=UPI003983F466